MKTDGLLPHWGGHRPGAGRPAHSVPSRCISVHLPEELIQILDREADRRRTSRSAIMSHYLREGIEKAAPKKKSARKKPKNREF